MGSIDLDLKETLAAIDRLKAMDLQTVSLKDIKERLQEITRHYGTKKRVRAGSVICRSLLVHDGTAIPTTISQISYNPFLETCKFNRASYENDTAFYGCLSTEIMQSYFTSAMEILPREGERLFSTSVVTGKWILQHDADFLFIGGGDNLIHLCEEGHTRHRFLFEHIRRIPENILSFKAIDTFLCNEFSKKVDDNERWKYKISAVYSQMLREEGHTGVIFPSVRANGAGLNIVIFPYFVDQGLISLERALYGTFYTREEDTINDYSMEAFPKDNTLIWRESYRHLLHPKIKAYYIGKSDDDSFKKYIPMTDLGSPIERG